MSDHRLEDSLAGARPWRRLFLDAAVVEETWGLDRVFHAAEKHQANPLIAKDRRWEGWGPYIYGTVLWDDDRMRMWYQCIDPEGGKIRSHACYAESSDGISWHKPELGIFDYNGSTANNVFDQGNCGIPSVIQVRQPSSPERAWAVYSWCKSGPHVAFSEDGVHFRWEEQPEHTGLFETSDVVNFFHDPYRDRWVATYKTPNRRHRAVGLVFSDDGITWRKPIEGAVFGADDLDPDATQVYGMPVFPYQGCNIGMPWMYRARYMKYGPYSPKRMYEAQEGSPRTVDVEMAWSWDLVSWTRPPRRQPFIALGPEGSWDSGMIYTARAPVPVEDKLYFYYGGCDNVHDESDVRCAIGLAVLRQDGFCSMSAGADEGWLLSRREVFQSPRVTMNARTQPGGYVTAEIVDRHNIVIDGFSRADCIPFQGDSVAAVLSWRTQQFPEGAVAVDRKIRFYLRSADLYSYLPEDIDQSVDSGPAGHSTEQE